MSATVSLNKLSLPAFENEPYADFTRPENAEAARQALADVRSQLGKEYELMIGGEGRTSSDKLRSLNPANPKEVVGIHQKGTKDDALNAIEKASAFFPKWSTTDIEYRTDLLLKLAGSIRSRKL